MKESDLNSILFAFTILDNGVKVDLTDTAIQLAIRKPSLLTVFQDCIVTDAINGACEVLLTSQAYNEVGNHSGELYLTKGETIVVTNSFEFSSLDAIMDDTTLESANEWSALHDLMLGYDKRPIIGSGNPNTLQAAEYIGQRYLDQIGMVMYFASAVANDAWLPIGGGAGGGGEGGPVYWNDVLSKPTTFPPSAHGHVWADITDPPTEMTPTVHTHDYNTGITNKPLTFPPSAHEHAIGEVTGLTEALASKLEAIPAEYLTETEGDLRYAPIGEVGGGGIAPPMTGAGDPTGAPDYIGQTYINTTSGEAFVATTAEGGWQTISMDELGGGAGTVTWDSVTEKPATFPPTAHNHAIGEITDLTTTLEGKSDDGHSHVWADITDAPTTMTPTAHTHDWTAGITGKPTTFPPPLASPAVIGGSRVGLGLAMTGEYLTVKAGTGLLVDNATTYDVQINRAVTDTWYAKSTQGLSIWKGTQAEYDLLTPNDLTLYFIVG